MEKCKLLLEVKKDDVISLEIEGEFEDVALSIVKTMLTSPEFAGMIMACCSQFDSMMKP